MSLNVERGISPASTSRKEMRVPSKTALLSASLCSYCVSALIVFQRSLKAAPEQSVNQTTNSQAGEKRPTSIRLETMILCFSRA